MEKATEAIQNCLGTIVEITEPEDDLKALLPPQDFDFVSLIDNPLPAMGQVNPCWNKGKFGDFEEEEEEEEEGKGEGGDKTEIKGEDLVPDLFNNTKGTPKFPEVMKIPDEVKIKRAEMEKVDKQKETVREEDKPKLITDLIMVSICTIAENFKAFGQTPKEESVLKKIFSFTRLTTTQKSLFEDFLTETYSDFSNAFFKVSSKEGKSGVFAFFLLFKLVANSFM